MKKLSSFLILFFLILSASVVHAQAALPQPDSLIKGSLPTIYYYAADGYRYVFPNDKTFGSWFSDYGIVITVSSDVLGQIPLKGNVTYRPGVRMVKITTVPKVYAVDKGGKLRWIKSEELAKKLYGDDWNKKVDDVPDEFFTNYQEGPPIENEIEYSPAVAVETTQTINYDRGIKESVVAVRATTKVGSLTEIRELIKDLKKGRLSLSPVIPPLILPPVFLPFFSSSTPTSTIPTIPTIPAIPVNPSTSTVTSTIPAIPVVPVVPVVPIIPVTPPTIMPNSSTSTGATSTPAISAAPTVFTVTSPNGGEQWIAGNTYTITWTSTGPSVSTVVIIVHKSGVYNTEIVANAVNNGSVNWTVPATMVAGSDYKIRVYESKTYTYRSIYFDESDNPFSIVVPTTAPSASPIGYWKFDGNGNSDIVGSPSVVTVGSATFKTSGGKFGGYLYMPGSSDYAKIPYNSIFDLQNFTIEFWFRQRSNQSFNQNLVYKGTPINNYNFRIFRYLWDQYNNGAVIAGATAAGTGYWHQVSNQNEPPHNNWHHVVYTKTTEGAAYYIDGALIHSRNYAADNSPEYAGPVKTPALDILIGNPAPDTDIDNLRIYKHALSRGEVLYNWQNTPDVAAVSDTTPPVISSLQATEVTATSTIILWNTNESADTQVEYGLTTSYGNLTSLSSNLTLYHTVALSNLQSSTQYHYRVKSKDAAGNLATSADQTFITLIPPLTLPPTPTNVQAVTTSGTQTQPPEMWYYLTFNYILQSTTQSFNVYRKRPTDASFVKYTYSAQTAVNPSILPLPVSNESNLYHRDPNQWQWWTNLPAPAPDTAQGEYKFYVTAVDTNGVESLPSETKLFKLYAAPVITSPADGSTVSSPFTITVSGDPSASSPTYGMTLYKKTTGDTAWSVWPAPSTNFIYTGQTLNPSDNPHRLVVWFSSGIYDRSLFRTSIFNISTTTLATASKIKPTQQLVKQNLDIQKIVLTGENDEKSKSRFTKSLGHGAKGDEVRLLQEVLAQFSEIYPEGLVTGYFGRATEKAVKRFQAQNNLEAAGIVGPKTRMKLNVLVGY